MAYVPINFGISNGGNTLGNSGTVSNQLVFAGGNNITLSQATNAQGSATITISAPNAIAQSNQTAGIYVTSNTTGQSSTSTYDARTLSIVGDGIVSVGWSNSTLRFSATQSNQAFSAQGGSSAFQTLSFSNANGISFTNTNGQVGASYTVPTVTNSSWTVSDNATSATVGRLAFTQSNGLTMSLSTSNNGNHTLIGSYTVPTVTNSSMTVSDNATSGTLARLAFTNLNGVSLSLSTGAGGSHTIVGSHNALTSQSNQAFSAQGGSSAFQTLSFSNANGISFTNTNGQVGASYTVPNVPAQTNQTAGIYITAQSTGQSSSSTYDARTLSIVGDGIISAGWSNSTLRLSATQSNQAFSAQGGSSAFQTLSFSNANGISFTNTNGQVGASYTVPTVTNSSMTVSDNATSGTLARLAYTNLNNVTLSLSTGAGGSHTIVGSYGLNVSATGGNSKALSGLTFKDSQGVSFGLSTGAGIGTITASHALNVSATGGTSNALSGLTFKDGNGVSFGLSTGAGVGTITASVNAAGGGVALYDGANSISSGTAQFDDANGVSFGINGQTMTASVASQTNQTLGMYALGNTTQNSSTTLDARTLSFNALGMASLGYSNGSIQVSIPNTNNFVGTNSIGLSNLSNDSGNTGVVTGSNFRYVFAGGNNITLSQATAGSSATLSVIGPTVSTVSDFMRPEAVTAAGLAQANSSVSVVPFYLQAPLAMSNVRIGVSISAASTTNTSSASQAYSLSVVLYTRNGSTLSSIWSGASNSNTFWRSNSSSVLVGGRELLATGAATTLPPDRYWAAVHVSTTNTGTGGNTTALGVSYSMMVGIAGGTNIMQMNPWDGGASSMSRNLSNGLGIYSTNNTLATIAFSDAKLTQNGNTLTVANLMIHMRNWTLY